jgi:hypothetical protein
VDTAHRLLRDRTFTGEALSFSDDPAYDYVDKFRRTYDAVGTPDAFANGNMAEIMDSLEEHVYRKQGLDFVVVDVTGANSSQLDQILTYLDSLPRAQFIRVKLVGD